MENKSEVAFVTGDQPVINTHAVHTNETVEDLELYYPLTPSLAFLLTQDIKLHKDKIVETNATEVKKYNRLMFTASSMQVYGSNPKVLKNFIINK